MFDPPRVSVVVPSFNAASTLRETLESLLAQTVKPFEIVVVDDASTDGSDTIAESFGSGVRLIRQPKSGAPAARNRGYRESRGDFVQFQDADDLLAPNKFEVQLARLIGDPTAIAICPWARFSHSTSEAVPKAVSFWIDAEPVDWLIDCWSQGEMMHPGTFLAARGVHDRAGEWDPTLKRNQDSEYFTRAVLASSRVLFCRDTFSYYRSGVGATISSSNSTEKFESISRAIHACVENLLVREKGPAAKRACSRLLEDFAYSIYPKLPDLFERAWALIRQLGGPYFRPQGGKLLSIATRFFGWKFAKRLQSISGIVRGKSLPVAG